MKRDGQVGNTTRLLIRRRLRVLSACLILFLLLFHISLRPQRRSSSCSSSFCSPPSFPLSVCALFRQSLCFSSVFFYFSFLPVLHLSSVLIGCCYKRAGRFLFLFFFLNLLHQWYFKRAFFFFFCCVHVSPQNYVFFFLVRALYGCFFFFLFELITAFRALFFRVFSALLTSIIVLVSFVRSQFVFVCRSKESVC